ncbi:serine O-acetyltransferase EpsC [Sphingomonas abietis]|uniref:serine O-acetyltransferase n=1 Tax=Sphingomonas abietis TaxID=3012344 RepID=A0ABY7NSJ3_9SPHN|nr:serine O-acetyltransferase EpsC [Sphingomonas abietis]WBO23760.1 serine O-acetyltransferase [Sphingomonas abietis]
MTDVPEAAFPANIDRTIDDLRTARLDWRGAHARHTELGVHFPSRSALKRVLVDLISALFPLRFGPPELTTANENAYVGATLETTLDQLAAQLILEFDLPDIKGKQPEAAARAIAVIGLLAARLADIRRLIDADVQAAYRIDPAANSVDEVLLSYPSLIAIIHHRIAHQLYRAGSRIVARSIAEIAHRETGIDIHPGAQIGPGLFIDHGTGVIIGETAVIGVDAHIHQGVTIGGVGRARGERRHPSIGDRVVIFPGAVLLGPIDIGADVVIDANVVLRQAVPEGSFVRAPRPEIGAHSLGERG